MLRLKIAQENKPLSEVISGFATYIKQVHNTKRPVVITQHGKGVAVLLGAYEYEAMQEKFDSWVYLFPEITLSHQPSVRKCIPDDDSKKHNERRKPCARNNYSFLC